MRQEMTLCKGMHTEIQQQLNVENVNRKSSE